MIHEKDCSVYILIDPISFRVKYVGQTKLYPKERMMSHRSEKFNLKKYAWIKRLKKNGMLPIIKVVEKCKTSDKFEREGFWIDYYRNIYGDIFNIDIVEKRDKIRSAVLLNKRMRASENISGAIFPT